MMKKILCLLLCAVFALALFTACGDSGSDSDTSVASGERDGAGTDTAIASDATDGSGTASSDVPADPSTLTFDETAEHKVIACDIEKHGIVIFDLDYCDGDWKKLTEPGAVAWEWCADTDPNCKMAEQVGHGISEAKLRWSEYYQKEVIIATSSSGWAGIIDYETKHVLWEAVPGDGPHSAEMLPNGDLAVACAGDGTYGYLRYYPVSQGANGSSGLVKLASLHGVCWDPQEEILWVLWHGGVAAVQINGYGTANAKPTLLSGMEAKFPSGGGDGHDMMPVFGQPGKYWVADVKGLWIFDTGELTFSKDYARANVIGCPDIKGNAQFPDNTFVQVVGSGSTGSKATYAWSTRELRIVTCEQTSGKVPEIKAMTTKVWFDDREFYKAHALNIDYQ